jgi:hypothetical protein
MVKDKVVELCFIIMEDYTKVNGKPISNMVKVINDLLIMQNMTVFMQMENHKG